MSDTPDAIVQKQADTYNAHDLEGFVATFSPDVALYTFPDNNLILTGQEALRQFYAKNRFNLPDLQAEVVNRITLGNFVIYLEDISGLSEKDVVKMIAIYEVEAGLIRRVWFIREAEAA